MILISICTLSIIANIFLVWYLNELLKGFFFLRSHYGKYSEELSEYLSHLRKVLEMDVLSDDPIIKSLMSHSQDILNLTDEHKKGFSIDEEKN